MPYWFQPTTVELEVGGKPLRIETGKLAKQAGGAAVVKYGESVVLTTVTRSTPREGIDFFPLTVEYVEKYSAAGKIPGGFFKREARLSDREILVCRFIDRACRPLFADGYRDETQVIATVLAADGENPTDILAFIGASAAFTISEIPFLGPIAAVRLGKVDGALVVNPLFSQREGNPLDLVVAGSRQALVMVEGAAKEIPEAELLAALQHAHREILPLIDLQEKLRSQVGKPKLAISVPADMSDLRAKVRAAAEAPLRDALAERVKHERYAKISAVEKKVAEDFTAPFAKEKVALDSLEAVEQRRDAMKKLSSTVKDELHEVRSQLVRERLLTDGVRIDGRGPRDIRQIACEVRAVPRAHGAALFTRGETQALVYTTLGSPGDAQTIDGMTERSYKQFLLHYNFPPFSVGEARMLRGPSRRDVGHGNLAERAIQAVLPPEAELPYTVRIVSEVLESNGSSSMATVCGATLSLLDAGIEISAPVAGIAMGLIEDGDRRVILSDILGDEDHLGDMDFKVAGTRTGITAVQMDIKIRSVDWKVMEQALEQARAGRLHILDCMESETKAELPGLTPRRELSAWAPRSEQFMIKPDRIRDIIGPGGRVIRAIQDTTGAKIDVEDDGQVTVFAPNGEALAKARAMVDELTQEAELDRVYLGKVKRITDFGAFVEIFPGTDGLIHISHLADGRVERVTDVVKEGDEVLAKCIDIDPSGRIRLSRKEALADALARQQAPQES
ncbi:MAG TPA: polyribonucleotide nucleotidyltransferase [Myxococcota bacterium]|nr:polyribonucleotide nucleotidyltransferase [Myxococcota bacterium]